MGLFGLQYDSQFLGPAIVLGVAAAGLYGLLAVTLVLTYRVSRTIGFVQGGIAIFGAYLYWWLTYDTGAFSGFGLTEPRMGKLSGMILTVAVGAVCGVVYGVTVTGRRMANWPRLTLTIYSLAWLVGLAAIAISVMHPPQAKLPSVFGEETYTILDGTITIHQVATLLFLVGVIGLLSFVLLRTQAGINIRAIADNAEASRVVGVPLSRLGTAVYAFAGAVSAFAGALLTSTVGLVLPNLLVIFLRALTVSVLGGFTSFSLALAGCVLLGVGESALSAGLFGDMSAGQREVIIMTALFALVLFINRLRPIKVLEAQAL